MKNKLPKLDNSTLEHFKKMGMHDKMFGTATIGDRGQVVIPAEARKLLNLNPGDQLVVIGNPEAHVVSFLRADTIAEFFAKVMEHISGTGLEEEVKKKFDKVFEVLKKQE